MRSEFPKIFAGVLALTTVLYFFLFDAGTRVRTFFAKGTGQIRLFNHFPPPDEPHKTVHVDTDRPVVVIGDIHGCFDEFEELLVKIKDEIYGGRPMEHSTFQLFLVGDLVNKGPKSAEVVKKVRAMVESGSTHVVRGNHEEALLEEWSTTNALTRRSKYSYISKLNSDDRLFLLQLPYTISVPKLEWMIVHAGLDPQKSLEHQEPDYMVRMRNFNDNKPTHLIEKGEKWVIKWEKEGEFRVIFGHDARRRLQQGNNYLGLDTGVVYGDRLTALVRLPNGNEKFISVPAKKAYEEVKGVMYHR
ncbi:unnamed protein product [Oikopleura dioica]|uniref:Calcineurin-like phosphoesterase domain-containing protein n=1 Tax=Oikopleura dioica TaxID=34765 RepID=E4XT95_OIKDI|nr:unnamed protein product [Oikopleura dioica]